MASEPLETSPSARFERAKTSGVVTIYANGYVNSIGTGDIVVLLERNGEPAAIVNMSYTIAKSLSVSLGQIIAQIEERAGREIMTSTEIEKLFLNQEAQE